MISTFRTRITRFPARWGFVIAFVLLCCLYEYGRVLHLRPQPHHIYRQCDCLGMTWNYAFTDANLFEPRMCNLHGDDNTSGRTAAEFPVIYWGVGMLWRVIGHSEFAFRLIMLLIHFAGSYSLFLLAWRISRSAFWGVWTSLLFFTSPVTAYFAISFLPDVPAFDLSLIGGWWFYRYFTERRLMQLLLALAFTSLAMLLKVTAGFFFVALLGVLVLETWWPGRAHWTWHIFPRPRRMLLWSLAALVPVVLWYAYSAQYNVVHNNPFTNTGLSHYWRISSTEAAHALQVARTVVVHEVFATPTWFLLAGFAMVMVVSFRTVPWQVVALNVLLFVGLGLYLIGWAEALNGHDYYFTCPQVVLIAMVITVLWWASAKHVAWLRSPWVRGVCMLVLCWSAYYTANELALRTRNGAPIEMEVIPTYFTQEHRQARRDNEYWENLALLDIEPYARSLGITREDKILVAIDRSWQVGLYLSGQTGWNDYTIRLDDSLSMAHGVQLGAKYLYLKNPEMAERPYMKSFVTHPIGRHKTVVIYDLRHAPGATPQE